MLRACAGGGGGGGAARAETTCSPLNPSAQWNGRLVPRNLAPPRAMAAPRALARLQVLRSHLGEAEAEREEGAQPLTLCRTSAALGAAAREESDAPALRLRRRRAARPAGAR
jgi:hypothetical protein